MKNKYIFFLFFFFIMLSSESWSLTCSFKGTDIILVNGVSWSPEAVQDTMTEDLIPFVNSELVDMKRPAANYVSFKISYNSARGTAYDLVESFSQKMSLSFGIPEKDSYVYAFFVFYRHPLTPAFIDKAVASALSFRFLDALKYITEAFNPTEYKQGLMDEYNYLVKDTNKLKENISNSLLRQRKLILISESQGNLFVNSAINDFLTGELLVSDLDGSLSIEQNEQGDIRKYLKVMGNLQIAPPNNSNLEKHKVVLNDEDIINAVFFDSPASTFLNFQDPVDDNRYWLDKQTDHFIDGTYLNAYGSAFDSSRPNSLHALKEFTLQSIIDTASLLESNCPKAVIAYDVKDLTVNFDSTDPDEAETTGLKYVWQFGDGQTLQTESKKIPHSYQGSGSYTVKLHVTDSENSDFGEASRAERVINVGAGIIGCKNEIGKYHINPDGSIGGFVSNTATVASTVQLDPHVQVCGSAQVLGSSVVANMSFSVGYPLDEIRNATIIDSQINLTFESWDSCLISGSKFLGGVLCGGSEVISSEFHGLVGLYTAKVSNSTFTSPKSTTGAGFDGGFSIDRSTVSACTFSVKSSLVINKLSLQGNSYDALWIKLDPEFSGVLKHGTQDPWYGPFSQFPW